MNDYDHLVDDVMTGMPESWGDDVVDYVRELERRVKALGGSLERYPETATRVRITPELWVAAAREYDTQDVHSRGLSAALKAAFTAAGFEVES